MKTMIRISLISLVVAGIFIGGPMVFTQIAYAHIDATPGYRAEDISVDDSTLFEIQDQIYQQFVQSIMQKDAAPLTALGQKLAASYTASPQNLILYWQSYLDYYTGIFYMQSEDEKMAESHIKAGIKRLESIDNKNAEDYALLAMIQSIGIRFASPLRAPLLSGKVKKYAEAALAAEAQNVRAHYVLASNDFYTPEKFGGGEVVEKHLQSAIKFPAQAVPNPYLPSWGKEEAHEMLIKFYMRKERWEDAKTAFQAASAAFPNNYQIQQLATNLVGK